MDAPVNISMNALVSHPDVLRWFLWAWKPKPNARAACYTPLTSIFEIMLHTPVDVCITNNTITIFKGCPLNISNSPRVVIDLFKELSENKKKYFDNIDNNYIFRNITCSECILNKSLEKSIDRIGWVTWSIYWIIKFQPTKFFTMKDIISISLRHVSDKKISKTNDKLPIAPWIDSTPDTIMGIYEKLQHTIYYECFVG
jgi:hypothetical protein